MNMDWTQCVENALDMMWCLHYFLLELIKPCPCHTHLLVLTWEWIDSFYSPAVLRLEIQRSAVRTLEANSISTQQIACYNRNDIITASCSAAGYNSWERIAIDNHRRPQALLCHNYMSKNWINITDQTKQYYRNQTDLHISKHTDKQKAAANWSDSLGWCFCLGIDRIL